MYHIFFIHSCQWTFRSLPCFGYCNQCCNEHWGACIHGKESACNAGDLGANPAPGRSPGEGNGYPLQCSCLENSMDRGACQATVHGVAKSQTQLSDQHFRCQVGW